MPEEEKNENLGMKELLRRKDMVEQGRNVWNTNKKDQNWFSEEWIELKPQQEPTAGQPSTCKNLASELCKSLK